jgi:hypothetical protein
MFDDCILHFFIPCEPWYVNFNSEDSPENVVGHQLYVLPNGEVALSEFKYWVDFYEHEAWELVRRWPDAEAFLADASYIKAIFGYTPDVDFHYWASVNFDEALRLGL